MICGSIDVARTGVATLKASGMKNLEFHEYPGNSSLASFLVSHSMSVADGEM